MLSTIYEQRERAPSSRGRTTWPRPVPCGSLHSTIATRTSTIGIVVHPITQLLLMQKCRFFSLPFPSEAPNNTHTKTRIPIRNQHHSKQETKKQNQQLKPAHNQKDYQQTAKPTTNAASRQEAHSQRIASKTTTPHSQRNTLDRPKYNEHKHSSLCSQIPVHDRSLTAQRGDFLDIVYGGNASSELIDVFGGGRYH